MNNVEFQDSVVEKTEGWLIRFTSLRTMDILDFQRDKGISGPLIEIGVFCGKYFSLLARAAREGTSFRRAAALGAQGSRCLKAAAVE